MFSAWTSFQRCQAYHDPLHNTFAHNRRCWILDTLCGCSTTTCGNNAWQVTQFAYSPFKRPHPECQYTVLAIQRARHVFRAISASIPALIDACRTNYRSCRCQSGRTFGDWRCRPRSRSRCLALPYNDPVRYYSSPGSRCTGISLYVELISQCMQ